MPLQLLRCSGRGVNRKRILPSAFSMSSMPRCSTNGMRISKLVGVTSSPRGVTPGSFRGALHEYRAAEIAFPRHGIEPVLADLEAVAHAPHEVDGVAVALILAWNVER